MTILGSSPIYPLWATVMIVLSLTLIPRKEYKYLILHGLLGALINGVIILITIHFIKAWKYLDAFPFSVLGVPVFILTAWGATIIVFLWALPEESHIWIHHLHIALFSITGVVLDIIFHNLGLRPYASWYRGWMWFFVLYGLFWIHYKIYKIRKRFS